MTFLAAAKDRGDTEETRNMSGKIIRHNIPNTETNSLPLLNSPKEEIQLDFNGPITESNCRFHICFCPLTALAKGRRQILAHLLTEKRW